VTPERWHAITEIFHEALARDAVSRVSYVADACADDGALRNEVEALLAAHEEAGSFAVAPRAPAGIRLVAPGAMLGPYCLGPLIGSGGMGEVYRATDTRLDRTVAIKILPSHLRASADLRTRFDREARAISQLSHPHICTLHDVGHENGIDFLVMEHLEGETLAARIARGALPLIPALRIGTEIASALDHAHRQGVVHRDLKPGNIMLTKAGAKLLDFGIAKLRQRTAGVAPLTDADPMDNTAAGVLFGTLAYMAPEQLAGTEADARSDIWALGCVMHEMLTGARAFDGIRPLAPPFVEHVVFTCLTTERDDRWQSAGDVARQLTWFLSQRQDLTTGSRGRPMRWIEYVAVAALAAVSTFAIHGRVRRPVPLVSQHVEISLRDSGLTLTAGGIAISPDGRTIVFTARSGDGEDARLYTRSLDGWEVHRLQGTEGAINPFFSPTGEWIAFIAGGMLQKIPAGGGIPQPLAKASYQANSRGHWLKDGRILINVWPRGLFLVPVNGGEPDALLPGSRSQRYLWPRLLPDGRTVLFTITNGTDSRIAAISLTDRTIKTVLTSAACARYLPTGHLVYQAGGRLMAAPFDSRELRIVGEAHALGGPSLMQVLGAEHLDYDVSDTGTVIYIPSSTWSSRLAWRDRADRVTPLGLNARPYFFPTLSPDGRHVAVTVPGWPSSDVWIGSVEREPMMRLSTLPNSMFSLFSPDGKWLAYSASDEGWFNVFRARTDGSDGPYRLEADGRNHKATSWSADGAELLINELEASGNRDIVIADAIRGTERRYLASPNSEIEAAFSTDGQWIAYQSDATGAWEIYVRPYDGTTPGRQVSVGGGMGPRWNPRGGELFYQTRSAVMAVAVRGGVATGLPQKLLSYRQSDDYRREFDVSPDGQRFLVVEPSDPRTSITLITNWFDELKTRVPIGN